MIPRLQNLLHTAAIVGVCPPGARHGQPMFHRCCLVEDGHSQGEEVELDLVVFVPLAPVQGCQTDLQNFLDGLQNGAGREEQL